jgi:hypothetical protein
VIAHLIIRNDRFTWSGYNAGGDPAHRPYALVVEIGREFIITSEENLYLIGPGPMQFEEFSPDGLALAGYGHDSRQNGPFVPQCLSRQGFARSDSSL